MSEKVIHIDTVVGSVFGNVKQEIHNHYGREAAHGSQSDFIEDAEIVEEPKKRPSFEEAIPEYLRTGRLMVAWNKLRKEGILQEDYQLAEGVSKAAANYLVTCFCERRQNNEWKPFEEFWGLERLKLAEASFSKALQDKISTIFGDLQLSDL